MAQLPGSQASDFWWLRPAPPDNPLPAMQLGAQIRQRITADAIAMDRNRMEQEKIRLLQQEQLAKEQLQTQIMQGSAELASFGSKITDWSQPDVARGLYELAIKSPIITKTEGWKGMMDMHQTAVNAKNQLAKDAKTADIWALEQADEWERQAGVLDGVNPERANQFRTNAALIRSKFKSPTEVIKTSVDAQGRPIVEITRGPDAGKASGELTTATQGQIQQRMIGFEKSINTAADLFEKLNPEMLGIKGLLGEVIVDKGLAQFYPELANKERIDGRTLLRVFNEQIIKSLKVDAQVNRDEERRLLAALPDPGVVSSLPDAQQKIKTFMGLIRDQARVDAQRSGQKPPEWASTADEIATRVASGELSKEQGSAIMRRYWIMK